MNAVTRNDLSADKVVLDYEALAETAEIAVSMLLRQIDNYRGKIDSARINSHDRKNDTALYLNAEWLLDHARLLAVACDTCSALRAGRERTIVEIVNHDVPEVRKAPSRKNPEG